MRIKNINGLREHAIETLEKLEKGKIDVIEAGVTAKLYESIMSSLKTELEYNKLLERKPKIEFLNGSNIVEIKQISKKLLTK